MHLPFCVGMQSFIDLAGSERASPTMSRLKEGCHINRSLLALGTVIRKLRFVNYTIHCSLSHSRLMLIMIKTTG